jgi:hypothetical protein
MTTKQLLRKKLLKKFSKKWKNLIIKMSFNNCIDKLLEDISDERLFLILNHITFKEVDRLINSFKEVYNIPQEVFVEKIKKKFRKDIF